MKYIIIMSALVSYSLAVDYFPINAWHVKDTLWFKAAGKDSLGLNMINYEEQIGVNDKLKILNKAHRESLDVMLRHATRSVSGTWGRDDIEWYCRLYSGQWEAESTCFYHGYGELVADDSAHNGYAWKVTAGAIEAMIMLKGPGDRARQNHTLNAQFFLKVDTLLQPDTIKICSLYVTNCSVLLGQRVLRVNDFLQTNRYQPCTLQVSAGPSDSLNYCITYFGKCDLWCDQVVSKDRNIDSLTQWPYYYNNILTDITSNYDSCQAMAYYYLLDEPFRSYWAANAYLMKFLRDNEYKAGIQVAWNYRNEQSFYQDYVDSVKPNVLMFDYYPLNKNIPLETGSQFQQALDNLCIAVGQARLAAISCNPDIPFWFVCQSFAQIYDAGGYAWLRDPTPRELKCMVWLAIAHGAKGINHFLYPGIHEGPNWADSGLVNQSTSPPHHRDSLWIPAQQMNFTLKDIGAALLTLTSDTVFKASTGIPPNCFIKDVIIWNMQDTLIQIGTFHKTNNTNDKYFIVVNRHCLPSESLEVVVELEDTLRYLYDCYTQAIITYETIVGGPITYGYRIKFQPGQGRLLRMVPFSSEFKINQNQTYANVPYVALRTKATSLLSVDSIKLWQKYIPQQETLCFTTNWLPYDTSYCWYLLQNQGTNRVFIQYKVGGFSESPVYSDTIILDRTAPTASFIINNNDKFTNTPLVSIKNSASDSRSGMSAMRYGNKYLKNLLKNSAFDTTTYWQTDTAVYIDSLALFKIPLQTDGNYFYQAIPPESLSQYDNDTMLLWIDLVNDSFVGTGKVEFRYVYTCKTDTVIGYGASIPIPQGINASVSHYNLDSCFKYHPQSGGDLLFIETRVGVFISANANNHGRLFIDNLRLDVVGPANDFTNFEAYDSLNSWTLTSGNGTKKVYGQFSDGAGNEADISFDTIIVDTTKPARKITSPQNGQTISNTIEIKGWAYDYADPQQHFKQYELFYRKNGEFTWYGVFPDSIFTNPVNFTFPPRRLGYWNTDTVTARHGDGGYDLRLAVRDSALNSRDTMVYVIVDNSGGEDGMIAGFSNYVYCASADNEIYIGEIITGKIYRYNENYQLIDTFKLNDSLGLGNPLAMINDDSGKLWIANIKSHTINRFSNQGSFEYRFSGNLSQPSGITFDDANNIWVSDRLHHKIKKFSPEGESLFAFGEKGSALGKINEPIGIDIYGSKLYIVDSKNKRISVFDTLGNFVTALADSAGLSLPFGIIIDSTGCFTVSDFQGNKVIEFDPWGSPLYTIDSLLDSPSGLALSSNQERLYVSDTKHKRVLEYVLRSDSTSGGGPQSNNSGNIFKPMLQVMPTLVSKNMMIRVQGMAGQRLSLRVYDPIGRLVKTLWDNVIVTSNHAITWDGRDSNNRMLGEGVYFIMLDAPELKQTRKIVLIR